MDVPTWTNAILSSRLEKVDRLITSRPYWGLRATPQSPNASKGCLKAKPSTCTPAQNSNWLLDEWCITTITCQGWFFGFLPLADANRVPKLITFQSSGMEKIWQTACGCSLDGNNKWKWTSRECIYSHLLVIIMVIFMGLYILSMGLLALIIGILGPSAWHLCEKYLTGARRCLPVMLICLQPPSTSAIYPTINPLAISLINRLRDSELGQHSMHISSWL